MFGTRVLSLKLGKALAIAALIAESVAAGKIIPHMLEVPDQSD
jgi:hypothetical protein